MAPRLRSSADGSRRQRTQSKGHPNQARTISKLASRSSRMTRDDDRKDNGDHLRDHDSTTNRAQGNFDKLPDAFGVLMKNSRSVIPRKPRLTTAKRRKLPTADIQNSQAVSRRDVNGWKYKNGLHNHLTPIHNTEDIIADMVGKSIDGLQKVIDYLNGRKLRVATLCSGTESPVLFLRELSAGTVFEFMVEH